MSMIRGYDDTDTQILLSICLCESDKFLPAPKGFINGQHWLWTVRENNFIHPHENHKQNVKHKHVMWLTVTSPPQSRMWAQRDRWAVFSLRSVNDVPKIGSNCQNETYKAEDTKGGHKTGQTCESDFHFVWIQLVLEEQLLLPRYLECVPFPQRCPSGNPSLDAVLFIH